ncbi:MAG: EamA family transporter [Actinomycetota bacterium]|nr:EamA family transporter [Actinomycetota bacterium]
MHDREGPDRLTLAAFGAAVLIGGSNFVAVKFSNAELAPMYGAAVRFTAAAIVFLLLGWALSLPLPRGRALLGSAVYGALNFGVAYGLLYFALLEISIGMSAVIMATVPLFTLILAVLHGQERFTTRGIVGGVLAVAGIGVLSLNSLEADVPLLYVLAAVLGAVAVAESTVLVKGFPRAHPVTTNGVGMVAGALLLWIASVVAAESWIVPEQARTWASLGWLVVAGSVGLFYLALFVIGRWTASASAYVLTLMPVVAVALGALLADEPITPEVVGGTALVLLAVYVGAIRRTTTKTRV